MNGIVMTRHMDKFVIELLKLLITNISKDLLMNSGSRGKKRRVTKESKELQRVINDLKLKLAETLVLAVFPGPTADVDVISAPSGVPGATIDFNSKRSELHSHFASTVKYSRHQEEILIHNCHSMQDGGHRPLFGDSLELGDQQSAEIDEFDRHGLCQASHLPPQKWTSRWRRSDFLRVHQSPRGSIFKFFKFLDHLKA